MALLTELLDYAGLASRPPSGAVTADPSRGGMEEEQEEGSGEAEEDATGSDSNVDLLPLELGLSGNGDAEAEETPPSPRTNTNLLSLPLELLTLIFSHLDLPTVFHLSRSNKRFYSFLRAPSMKYLWEKAREESGLPQLTAPGMDEVGLANLLFGCCKGCGKATAKVDCMLRIRCCKTCAPRFIVTDSTCSPLLWPYMFLAVCNKAGFVDGARQKDEYLKVEVETIAQLVKRYKSTTGRGGQVDSVAAKGAAYAGFDVIEDAAAYARFKDECEAIRSKRRFDAEKLRPWLKEFNRAQSQEIRLRRRNEIESRLTECGWRPHLFRADAFGDHPLVELAEPFNDDAWPAILTQLETVLTASKHYEDWSYGNRELIRRATIVEYQYRTIARADSSHGASSLYPLPCWHEAGRLPSVEALWTIDSIEDAYAPDPSLDDPSEGMKEELKALRKSFQMGVFERVVEVLQQVEAQQPQQKQQPTAAASTTASRAADFSFGRQRKQPVSPFSSSLARERQRRADGYAVSPSLVSEVLRLVTLAGKPVNVSAEEMDNLGCAFTCIGSRCPDPSKATAVPWYEMLRHLHGNDGVDEVPIYEEREQVLERLYEMHARSGQYFHERGKPVEL